MTHIGPLLKARRRELGWSIQKVATLAGLHPSFVSRIENKKSAYSPETVGKLMRAMRTNTLKLHGSGSNVDNVTERDEGRLPMIEYVRAGQLDVRHPAFSDQELQDGVMSTEQYSAAAFCLRLKGRSMEPRFYDRDLIVIDPGVQPEPGNFVLACVNSETQFAKYRDAGLGDDGSAIFELSFLNPDYPAVLRSDRQRLRVIGTMVEHRALRRT